MMKIFLVLLFVGLSVWGLLGKIHSEDFLSSTVCGDEIISDSLVFTLKKGDILIRPNWRLLPGTCNVENGRMFGHAAIVTETVSGKSIDEVLAKTQVIEAVVFDQATREFQFSKEKQIRETKAAISFGDRFKGIRYRLRMNLSMKQIEEMMVFLKNQMDEGYSVFALKNHFRNADKNEFALLRQKRESWHCASLAWGAYFISSGCDIDANKGLVVFPSDIISSPYFDSPDGRIRF